MKSPVDGGTRERTFRHWKERVAFVASLLAAIGSAATLGGLVPGPFRFLLGLLLAIIAVAYLGYRRVPSPIEGAAPTYLYPRPLRRTARWCFPVLLLVMLLPSPILLGRYYFPSPRISSISPSRPAAGERLAIEGDNFGADPVQVIVRFNGISASRLYVITPTRLELQVPVDATPGPLLISVKRPLQWLIGEGSAIVPYVDLRPEDTHVMLLTEDPLASRDQVVVRFSVRNTQTETSVYPL